MILGGICIRTLRKIFVGVILLVVTVQVAAFIALQIPSIQTSIVKRVTKSLEKSIDGEINIDKVYLVLFNRIILSDISIVSKETTPHLDSLKSEYGYSDTLISCKKLSLEIYPSEILSKKIAIKSVALSNGSFNLQTEGNETTNLSRIFRINKKEKDSTKNSSINLLTNNLKLNNFRFTLKNSERWTHKDSSTINFTNLDIRDIYVDIRDINVANDTIWANVNNITGTDISGFKLQELSGDATICGTEAKFNNLYATDGYSIVNAESLSLLYNSPKDFSDFINSVRFDANFNDSYLDFKTIGRIAPTLKNSSLAFYVNGKVKGPVSDLKSKSLTATSTSGQTFVDLKFSLTGLPEVKETMMFAEVNNCYTTSRDIGNIVSSINNTPRIPLFYKLPPFIRYNFNGNFTGLLTDFVTYGELKSSIGTIAVDALLNTNSGTDKGVLIKGKVSTQELDLGKITSSKMVGNLSMRSTITTVIDREEGINLTIDSVSVSKMGVNGYNYSNIFAVGNYNEDIFDGRIICHDPNLDFLFQGLLSFEKEVDNEYKFYLDLPYANLANLNIDKRDSVSSVVFRTIADFTKTKDGDIIGNVDIRNFGYANSTGDYNIGNINLKSYETADSSYSTIISAPFVKAAYNGTAPFTSYIKKFMAISLHSPFSNFFTNIKDVDKTINKKDNYKLAIKTFDTRGVCEFILPGLYIAENTSIVNTISKENDIDFKIASNRLAYNNNYIKDVDINLNNINNNNTNFNLFANSSKIVGINMDSLYISLSGGDNSIESWAGFKSDSTKNTRANLHSTTNFKRDSSTKELPKVVEINIHNSELDVRGEKWFFKPAMVVFADSTITLNNVGLYNKEQSINLNGGISNCRDTLLAANLNNFNLNIFNLFMNREFNFKGFISGKAEYSNYNFEPKLFLDLVGDSISVAGEELGSMRTLSKWNQEERRFNLLFNAKEKSKSNILATGYYEPKSKYLDIKANLDEFKLGYFEPFLADIISNSSGDISGRLNLKGPVDKLDLIGDSCIVNKYNFTVNFTQTPYTLNGPVVATKEGVFSNGLKISDGYSGTGTVFGGLKYNNFRDLYLDADVNFKDIKGLSTTIKNNELFYGNAYATGNLAVQGPLNRILLDINLTSNANTSIHIPLSDSYTASKNNLLTFKSNVKDSVVVDTYDLIMQQKKKIKEPTELQVNLNTNVNPLAEVMIEINKEVGDVIKARGTGLLSMDINPNKEIFNVYGDYNITQGSYKFVFMGIAPKDFTIQPGGVINFNGDIANTTIDLTATYSTKAAINTLIADTSSVSTRRTVNCGIIMSGSLMNPELAFSIDIPDIDPTTKVLVESALNTEGKIQKQFMALILSGSFIPDEQSGIANNTTLLYSNASEILSNQLNNIFQQLNIPVDLGLNYQPGTSGTDIFDVAVSTELFNNRVSINGNIGNDPYSNKVNSWDVIGNIDVEVKLDKNGKVRLTIFSHAADKFSNYLDEKQRSGVGIGYQQEFNSFRDIFRGRNREANREKRMLKRAKKEEEQIIEKEIEN